MNLDLADIGALLFVFTPLALLLLRIFVIPDGASLEDLIVPRMDFEWPRGVQEEEPVRWQVERLTPRDQRVSQDRRTQSPEPSGGDRVAWRAIVQLARRRPARDRAGQARARSLRIRSAASLPGAPITQPPGCVPEPHW